MFHARQSEADQGGDSQHEHGLQAAEFGGRHEGFAGDGPDGFRANVRSNASATSSAPATSLSTRSGNYAGFGYGWRKSTSPSFRDSPPGAGGPPDDFGYALAAE